jgi:hypothetical protein
MSTILKALRRLEDEKQVAADRPLRDSVAARAGDDRPPRRRGALWLAVGVAAGVTLGAAGAFLGDARLSWLRPEPAPSAPAPEAATPIPVAPAPPDAAPAAASPSPAPPAAPLAAPEPPAPDASAAAPRPPEPPRAAAAPRRPAATAPVPAAPKPPPEPALAPVKVVAPPAPPRLLVTGTEWHPDAARRVAHVQLEGRDGALALREGDAVGSLVVREIEPSGVVFRLGDVELRRRVGEEP